MQQCSRIKHFVACFQEESGAALHRHEGCRVVPLVQRRHSQVEECWSESLSIPYLPQYCRSLLKPRAPHAQVALEGSHCPAAEESGCTSALRTTAPRQQTLRPLAPFCEVA